MDNNVMIKIKTYQDIDCQNPDEPIELETGGKFGIINNKYFIKYEESDMTGFPDTVTTLKIWEGNVIVTRRGKYNMKLCYVEGKRNLCLYPTPYGEIGASIKTFNVDFDFGDKTGWLKVDYTIDADNENFCKNSLNISINPIDSISEEKPKIHKINRTV